MVSEYWKKANDKAKAYKGTSSFNKVKFQWASKALIFSWKRTGPISLQRLNGRNPRGSILTAKILCDKFGVTKGILYTFGSTHQTSKDILIGLVAGTTATQSYSPFLRCLVEIQRKLSSFNEASYSPLPCMQLLISLCCNRNTL